MSEDPILVEGIIEVAQSEIALLLESGHLLLEMQKYQEAEEIFAGVAALVPHSEVPMVCLGNLAFSQGQTDRALRFHRDAVARNPESAFALAHKGEILLFLNKSEGKADLEKAIELDGDGPAGQFAKSVLDAHAAGLV